MSDDNQGSGVSDLVVTVLAAIAILAAAMFLYGIFIYNHTQDVNRDKYLIDHCKSVSVDKPITNAQVFTCGVQK